MFAVTKKGDFITNIKESALLITPSINIAFNFARNCEFPTDITSINE